MPKQLRLKTGFGVIGQWQTDNGLTITVERKEEVRWKGKPYAFNLMMSFRQENSEGAITWRQSWLIEKSEQIRPLVVDYLKLHRACPVCGHVTRTRHMKKTSLRHMALIDQPHDPADGLPEVCGDCHFWLRWLYNDQLKVNWFDGFVVEGQHYSATDTIRRTATSGFGGRLFTIQNLETGQVLQSCDVWHQGEIPKRFRPHFPDTARFMNLETQEALSAI